MKVLISRKTGKYYYYTGKDDFHCKDGVIKKEDIFSGKSVVKSHLDKELLVLEGNLYDMRQKFSRGPQTITPKDLGYVIARSGVNKHSKIIEAGGGSGSATCFFANLVKTVHTYEIREENVAIIQKNIDFCKLDNVKLTKGDINEEIAKEKDADLLFLDMPDVDKVIEKPLDAVKNGSYIVCYVPSITQVSDVTKVIGEREDLYLEEITEVVIRHWKVWEKIARPQHRKEIDHTAFLIFIRKI